MAQPAEKGSDPRAEILPAHFSSLSAKEQKQWLRGEKAVRYSALVRDRRLLRKYTVKPNVAKNSQDKETERKLGIAYAESRKAYLHFIYFTEGYDSYKRSEKIENQLLKDGVSLTKAWEITKLTALGAAIVAVPVAGGISAVVYVGAGVLLGSLVRNMIKAVDENVQKSYEEATKSSLAAGETPEEFERKNAAVISKRIKSKNKRGWARFAASTGAGLGLAVGIGASFGQALEQMAQEYIQKLSAGVIGEDAARYAAQGLGLFDAALQFIRETAREIGHTIAQQTAVLIAGTTGGATARGSGGWFISEAQANDDVPRTTGPKGGVYRDIELGGDPVGSTPEAAIENAREAAKAAVADGRWSQETADAFLKWLEQNKKAYIEAVKTGKSNGVFQVVELKGNDRNFAWMADGEKGGYDTQGNVRVPDGTKAVVGTFSYTDAQGKTHTVTIKSPIVCNNFGEAPGAEVVTTPEVAPKPKNLAFDLWGQLMCPDGGRAQYYIGFTLTDLGNFDADHWQDALKKVFEEKIKPALPEGYKPDYVIARVDLNHDGVPDQLVKINVKTGEISDWTVKPDKGPAINVSDLPPEQRDQFIEANERRNTIGIDPTASTEEARRGIRGGSGPLQSTPNPVDRLKIGPDGKMILEIPVMPDGSLAITPEQLQQLVNEHIRLFIQGVLGKDVPVDFNDASSTGGTGGADAPSFPEARAINKILSTPIETLMKMSAHDIAMQYGLSDSQAQELLDRVKVFELRTGLHPEKGESLMDFLVRASAKLAQKVR